jgi:hypothetical protein
MPALPSPGKVIRIHLRFGPSDTNIWGSRFYVSYTGGPPTAADMTSFASDVYAYAVSDLVPHVESTIFLQECQCVDLSSDTGNVGTHVASTAGGDTSGKVPEDVAAVVGHTIGRRYRGGKPKTFLPPGGLTALADDTNWTPTFVTALLGGWQAFVAFVLADAKTSFVPANIVNVSYYKGFTVFITSTGRARNIPTQRAAPQVDVITNSSVNGLIGSQRRRRTAITG